jgi:hypothetical protein
MGRHGSPADKPPLPWELIGWTAFAALVAVGAMVLLGESWVTALLVLCAGAVAVLVVVGLTLVSPRSGASSGRRRDHL